MDDKALRHLTVREVMEEMETPQFVIITCTRIKLIRIFQTPRLSNTVYPIEYGHVRHVT